LRNPPILRLWRGAPACRTRTEHDCDALPQRRWAVPQVGQSTFDVAHGSAGHVGRRTAGGRTCSATGFGVWSAVRLSGRSIGDEPAWRRAPRAICWARPGEHSCNTLPLRS